MMFLSGFLIASAIGRYFYLKKEREFRATITAIAIGEAEADESGRVGWLLGA